MPALQWMTMPATHQLLAFLPIMLAVAAMPGPDMLFVLAQSAKKGTRAGLFSVLGVICGGFVHIGAAAVGLSALLMRSALLFSVLKYVGSAYLVYLGIRMLLESEPRGLERQLNAQIAGGTGRSSFAQGFITNVTNPKVALFVLAFLPQFVTPGRGEIGLQFAVLGAIWYATGAVILSVVACAAGGLEQMLRRNARARSIQRTLTGGILIALGLRVALPEHR